MQFWDSPSAPSDVTHFMGGWANHPSYAYDRFTDERARQYLVDHFGPSLVEAYDYSHHAAMKSDIFRLAYLYHDGGIWVDADDGTTLVDFHTDFSSSADVVVFPILWDTEARNFVSVSTEPEKIARLSVMDDPSVAFYLNNSPLGSAPRSNFIQGVLEAVTKNVLRAKAEGRRTDIHTETGPGTMTACFALKVLKDGFGVGSGLEMSSCYDFIIERKWCDYKGGAGHWSNV